MPPNILLLVLDCVRADGLHCYGNPRPVTPRLDALAASSRVYTQAHSASVWTLPSHTSLFTGLHPQQHRVDFDNPRLDASIPTLAETLHRRGYQTAAFSTNAWVGPHFGLDRGFEHFDALWRIFPSMGRAAFPWWEKALRKRVLERHDKGARKLNQRLRRWWRQQRDPNRPFFLFGLYLDAHLPYRPPREYAAKMLPASALSVAGRANQDAWAYMAGEIEMTPADFASLRALFDAEIAYVDDCLSDLLDFLSDVGALDNTILIITADHGENIGDHGLMDHQYCVYETLAHVPLLIHYPPAFSPGVDGAPVQHTDIFPTLLDITTTSDNAPQAPHLPGQSLLTPIPPDRPTIIQYTSPHRHRFARRHPHFHPASKGYDRTFDAIINNNHKLIRAMRTSADGGVPRPVGVELYNLINDPAETTDLADSTPDIVAHLNHELDVWLTAHSPAGAAASTLDIDEGLRKHLQGLGYL